MLNVFRENLRHLKWVLILVIVGLVLYLGFYFGGDQGSVSAGDWVAKVDGQVITAARYRESARRLDDYYRQMMGDRYEQFRSQMDIGAMTANALVDEAIQLQEARRLGLEATPAEVARTIQNNPQLKDANGQFIGAERYREVISRNWPGGLDDYENKLRDEITTRKWSNLATEAVGVSDREIEERYRSRANRTRVDYAMVAASEQKFDKQASQNDLLAYYKSHEDSYRRGEARKIRYFVVDRQAQMDKVQISDAEVRAYYDGHPADFARKDQRRVRHILTRFTPNGPPEEQAAARKKIDDALARVRAGEEFATVAQQVSQDVASATQGGDLGYFERGRMVAAFDQAAFDTPVGQLSPIVETNFGFHLIQVIDSRPPGTQPFEDVKASLTQQLRLRQAQERTQAEAEVLRGRMKSAADLDAVAAEAKLPVQEKILARDDRLNELQASPQFLEAVFALEIGTVSAPLGVAKGMAVVASLETLPPAPRPFEDVVDRVRTDLLNARGRDSARAAAASALARHKTLEEAAKALGVPVRPPADTTPGQGLAGTGGVSPELEAALFGPTVAAGESGTAPVPAGAVIYRIAQVERFDPTQLAARKEQIRQEILNQRKSEFVAAMTDRLRQNHKIEMNYELLGESAE